jgi:serine/threonine protein kinase
VNPKDETTEIFLDLVSKMLRYDPSERIRAAEALSHPFFSLDGGSSHG